MQTYGCTDAMLKKVLTMLVAESTYCTTPCAKLKKTIATLNTAFMYATSGSKVQHRFDKNTGTLDDDDNQLMIDVVVEIAAKMEAMASDNAVRRAAVSYGIRFLKCGTILSAT